MILTKEERHIAYIIMLAEADTKVYRSLLKKNDIVHRSGFCHLALHCFGLYPIMRQHDGYDDNDILFKKFLPELYNKRPNSACSGSYWFDDDDAGWEIRKKLLQECINKTA